MQHLPPNQRTPARRVSRYRRNRTRILLGWLLLIAVALALVGIGVWRRLNSSAPGNGARPPAAGQVGKSLPRRATPDRPLTDIARAAGIECDPIADARLLVDKSDLELRFFSGETRLKTYPIARGSGDLGDKERRNDGRTPEGEFRIVRRVMQANPQHWGDVWMLLSYPTPEDAERGLAARLINREQHRAIVEAAEQREIPPQNTDLGSGIGIHIGGIKPANWTQGCMALERDDGIEVYQQTRLGTPVAIQR